MTERGCVAAALTLLWLTLAIAGCSDDDEHDVQFPTATATATLTATRTVTRAATAPSTTPPPPSTTATLTAARTPALTPTASAAAATPSVTPSETPDVPEITFFGLARADDLPLAPAEFDTAGRPVFDRREGQALTVVLEARRGAFPLELAAYDPGGTRGVEFLVSRPLGNGSAAVCDYLPPLVGGVPGTDPPVFSDDLAVDHAIDDLGCRVNDGTGAPVARLGHSACTRMEPSFEYGFVAAGSELQFCLPIDRAWGFPVGDTVVAARVRDTAGLVSATREMVVRVERDEPFVCDRGLGERAFTPRRPQSHLTFSDTAMADASVDPWRPAVLRICAGSTVGAGIYPLTVREDAVLGLSLADGGVLCARVSARGSSGTIDCDGGTAADVRAVQDEKALTRVAVDSGLGLDAGTGAAVLRAPVAIVQLAAGATSDDCEGAEYPQPFSAAFTTALGTAQVLDLDGTVLKAAGATGTPFSCEAWRSGGAGALVLAFPLVNSPAGDRAAVLTLAE